MPQGFSVSPGALWRVWLALAIAASISWAGYRLHHAGYESGRAEVQAQFDAYRATAMEQSLSAQAERHAKESAMQATNEKVTANYVSLQTATASAVLALDADRVRLQAALAAYRSATGSDPGAGLPIDGAALVGSFAECIDRYSALAGEFDREGDTLRALQAYVAGVVLKP